MRRQVNNVISVVYSAARMLFLKICYGNNFKSGFIERISPNVVCEFDRGSNVMLGNRIRIHSGSKIKARTGARLRIEEGVSLNYGNIIVCRYSISIGEGTECGPYVCIYDHDHDYRAGLKEKKFKTATVEIGKNCWIGANTVILRGTKLGDNCVVGAGCVIKGIYPDDSMVIQKRTTEAVHDNCKING